MARRGIVATLLAAILITTAIVNLRSSPTSAHYHFTSIATVRQKALRQRYLKVAAAAEQDSSKLTAAAEQDSSLHQQPPLLQREDILRRIPPGKLAFFTLANSAYSDLAVNWALLIRPVLATVGAADHYFVGALDKKLAQTLLAQSVPTMRAGLSGAHDGAEDAPTTNFRLKFSQFRAYGVTKAEVIAWLLRENRDVVVSDVDCAWLHPPHFLLQQLAEADVMAGTDCLDVIADDDRSFHSKVTARCGHHPGSMHAAWFNTGVLLFRATGAAISFAERWRDAMAAVAGDGSWGNQVDDQFTFNQLVEWNGTKGQKSQGYVYPVKAARDDGRIIFDASGVRKIAPLPARTICSGHVFHIQQGIERRDCILMHLTFVEADRAGKRWRLREAGLYPIAPELVGGGRRFLTYTPPQPLGPVPPERHPSLLLSKNGQSFAMPMPNRTHWGPEREVGWLIHTALEYAPRLGAHMELVDRHVYAMKHALAIARTLGRELIMPRLLCLCERAQQPWDVVPTCVKSGTTTSLPFVCPMENFLNVEELEGLWSADFATHWSKDHQPKQPPPARPYVTLRPWTMLNASFHPDAAEALAADGAKVTVRWTQQLLPQAGTGAPPRSAEVVDVPLGLTDVELRDALRSAESTPLIHLESAELSTMGGGGGGGGEHSHTSAPMFGGFVSPSDAHEFEEEVRRWVIPGESRFSGTWCCTHAHYQAGTLLYKIPAPFPTGPQFTTQPWAQRMERLKALVPERLSRECYWDDCDVRKGRGPFTYIP